MNDLSQSIEKNFDLIEKIMEIEAACFERPWSKTAVVMSLQNEHIIYFVEEGGYVIGTRLCGDYELYRIAVLPEYRLKGLAAGLMRRFLEKCDGDVFLELEWTNFPAYGLYKKFGFKELSRRDDYYGRGRHAVTMKREYKHDDN